MAENHIGCRESKYVAICIAPDVCKVGDAIVPFDSFQDLTHEKIYISNVRARGNPILTVDCIIAGTRSNAGKGVSSGTSLGSGDCRILTGVDHIKCKGKPVARNLSLVAMNNDNTVGKLYTQTNPPNQIIPVKESSLWARYLELQRQQQEFELESKKQEADAMIGLGKAFINGWYMLGALIAKGQMQNDIAQMESNIALARGLGMDTQIMERANETNREVMETIDPREPLLKPANETQAMAMEVEPWLDLMTGVGALVKGLVKFSAKFAIKSVGRMGRSGAKIVLDANGLPIPVPPSVGAAGRVPRVLQTGGNTLEARTARELNEFFGKNINRREWGKALEKLKKDLRLRGDHHGRILDNGDYIDDSGNILGNIEDYL
ncbi:TPA: DUF4150 domain-containing protein [Escherichia coli]|nr:DUF4150 domain-containing protein [Escherichia coli]